MARCLAQGSPLGANSSGVSSLICAKGRWKRFTDLTGPIEINPNAMAVTGTHVFAGTLSKGLLAFDRRTERWTTIESGLPSMNVTALAADGDHLGRGLPLGGA